MGQIFCILLLLSLSGTFSKYVYVDQEKSWYEAQRHCQQYYTDLAPINNEHDVHQLELLSSHVNFKNFIWIGLKRNSSDRNKWTWSEVGSVSWFVWGSGQPNGGNTENYGVMHDYVWYDTYEYHNNSFFCYKAIVVEQRKTWEDALEYCREHHDDLASVASETEMLLIQKELTKNDTSEYVWIGLHFFPGDWLWVDGQEMGYEAWGQGGKPSCPHAKMYCGALQVNQGKKSVWEAHDCEERLSFICY